MPLRVLITGITGFAGSHLAERLVTAGAEVHGLAFEDPPFPHLAAVDRHVHVHKGDITHLDEVREGLAAARPDVVVHLAGQAVPTLAAKDPVGAVRVNVLGTSAVLAALDELPATRLVLASSAEVYGDPGKPLVNEDAPVRPRNPYAATKLAAEALARELGDRGDRAVVILRPTNQIGARQHPGLAASAFAKQVAEAEAGGEPVIRHGLLSAKRDFLDVRDMADAYARAAEIGEPGTHVFNVGTGHAVSIQQILAMLIGLSRVPLRDELDSSRVRSGAETDFAIDATRFRQRTGWMARTPLESSLRDLLDYWRTQTRQSVKI